LTLVLALALKVPALTVLSLVFGFNDPYEQIFCSLEVEGLGLSVEC